MDSVENCLILNRKPVFQLGCTSFVVNCTNEEFVSGLLKLLPVIELESPLQEHPVEFDVGTGGDLRQLSNRCLQLHQEYLWLRAACLVTPSGKVILICGQVHSGKSTLAMCLALGSNWKVVSEDIVLIHLQHNHIVNFSTPFCVKNGTADSVQLLTGRRPEPLVLQEWFPSLEWSLRDPVRAKIDVVYNLEVGSLNAPLAVSRISSANLLKKTLSYSNLLRVQGAEVLERSIGNAQLFTVTGGTPSERLALLLQRADG